MKSKNRLQKEFSSVLVRDNKIKIRAVQMSSWDEIRRQLAFQDCEQLEWSRLTIFAKSVK
jgi:hypothetical protein